MELAQKIDRPAHLSRGKGCLLFLAMCIFFLLVNRGAYRGYFHADDLDTLSWERSVPSLDFALPIFSPYFEVGNFRPAAAVNYNIVEKLFGLEFPPYIVLIHGLHLLNIWLVWVLARRFGADIFGASAASLFFGFHMASFDIYWKALFMFDLECGTFCLVSLLFYTQRRHVLSFVAFWLAYKCKELGVMLPAVFVLYEFWRGDRRWRKLIPFFLVSASFGLQGIFLNPHVDDPYTIRFTLAALITTSRFYSSYFFLIHHAAFVLVPLAFIFGNDRARFGIVMMLIFMVPFAFLPGRLEPAYCYVPLIGLAVTVSGFANRRNAIPATLLLTAWVGYNLYRLQPKQVVELDAAEQNRTYVAALAKFVQTAPSVQFFIFDGAPLEMRPWGIHGALRYLRREDVSVFSIDSPITEIPPGSQVGLLNWDSKEKALRISVQTRR